MRCVLKTHAPEGTPTAGACFRSQSWSDYVATGACDPGGPSGMHDIVPVGKLVVDSVGRIKEDICFASACLW